MYGNGSGAMVGCGEAMSIGKDQGLVGAMAQTAARQPEVRAEMDRLEKVVEILGMTAETLAQRLDPVRSQVGNPPSGGGNSAPEPVLCGVAGAIRTQRQRVETAQAILQRALNELEI